MNAMKTGTLTGTGAAINVQCGFVPKVLIIMNLTTAGLVVWHEGMAAGKSMTLKDAAVYTSSQGITQLSSVEVSGVVYNGFRMGTDCNALNDSIVWVAFR